MGKTKRLSRVAALILIFTNLFFMIFCCLLFALSLWIISSPDTLLFYIEKCGPVMKVLFPREFLDVQLGIALSLLAIFFYFIAFMGFCGALNCSQFLLFMYSILLILLLMLECALIFYYTSNIMEKGLQVEDGQITHMLRIAFHCCDRNYTSADQIQPPWSCCGINGYPNNCTAEISYTKNCQKTITTWFQKYQGIIYTSLVALHVLLSSCSLLRRAYSSSFSHT